jgi:formylmethanofuran dehydrogenase subunit B
VAEQNQRKVTSRGYADGRADSDDTAVLVDPRSSPSGAFAGSRRQFRPPNVVELPPRMELRVGPVVYFGPDANTEFAGFPSE